jgi:hypothetical protein
MSRYAGKIKVVNEDRQCFPADPVTLEAESISQYDAQPYDQPDAVEVIHLSEWLQRLWAKREAKR